MSVNEHIGQLIAIKNNIKQTLISKGVSVANVPFTQYHSLINNLGGSTTSFPQVTIAFTLQGIVIDSSNIGSFSHTYLVYDLDTLLTETSSDTIPLSLFSAGEHSVKVKVKGSGFITSGFSNAVDFSVYSLTFSLSNITTTFSQVVLEGGNATISLVASENYYLPTTISVTNSDYLYDCYTGELSLNNITGNVVITAQAQLYPILAMPNFEISKGILTLYEVENATNYYVDIDDDTVEISVGDNNLKSYFTDGEVYSLSVYAVAQNYTNSKPNTMVYQKEYSIYGVSGMDIMQPLTRTDDAIGLTYVKNNSTGLVVSDFDDLFPWCDFTIETINGNDFVLIPEMYFRIITNDIGVIQSVAVSKEPSGSRNWFKVDAFRIGRYGGSVANDKLRSVSGVARAGNYTIQEFRTFAQENGNDYYIYDIYHHTVLAFLWYIEYCNKNSSQVFDCGIHKGLNKDLSNTGSTNGITTPSGFITTNGVMRYHYIEDFIGNYLNFYDGVCYENYYLWKIDEVNLNLKKEITSIGLVSGIVENYYWNNNYPFYCSPYFVFSNDNNSYKNRFNVNSFTNGSIFFGGISAKNANYNMGFSYMCLDVTTKKAEELGSRLMMGVENDIS